MVGREREIEGSHEGVRMCFSAAVAGSFGLLVYASFLE